jgi:hypothetical protein
LGRPPDALLKDDGADMPLFDVDAIFHGSHNLRW